MRRLGSSSMKPQTFLDRLDEMGLPRDEVDSIGLFDIRGDELHGVFPFWRVTA
jgi:hypothetical protein